MEVGLADASKVEIMYLADVVRFVQRTLEQPVDAIPQSSRRIASI